MRCGAAHGTWRDVRLAGRSPQAMGFRLEFMAEMQAIHGGSLLLEGLGFILFCRLGAEDGHIELKKVPLRDRLAVEAMLQYQKDPLHQQLCAVTDGSGLFHVCPTSVDLERPELAGRGWNASHAWDFCGDRWAGPWRPEATEVSVHQEVSEALAPEAPQLPEREAEPPEEPRSVEEPINYMLPPVPAASAQDLQPQANDAAELQAAQTAQPFGFGGSFSMFFYVFSHLFEGFWPCFALNCAPRACMPLLPALRRAHRHLRRGDFLVACA